MFARSTRGRWVMWSIALAILGSMTVVVLGGVSWVRFEWLPRTRGGEVSARQIGFAALASVIVFGVWLNIWLRRRDLTSHGDAWVMLTCYLRSLGPALVAGVFVLMFFALMEAWILAPVLLAAHGAVVYLIPLLRNAT